MSTLDKKTLLESESVEIPVETTFPTATKEMNIGESTEGNEHKESDMEKEDKAFIRQNLYINGKSAEELEATITPAGDLYTVEFKYKSDENKYEDISIDLIMERDSSKRSMIYHHYKYNGITNTGHSNTIEFDETTHKQYDIIVKSNGNRINFNIEYNDIKTKMYIENLIKSKGIKAEPQFKEEEDFENTQLCGLSRPKMTIKDKKGDFLEKIILGGKANVLTNPKLGEKDVKVGSGHYKTLYYSINGEDIDIAKVYYKQNGDFDAETTQKNYSADKIKKRLEDVKKDLEKLKAEKPEIKDEIKKVEERQIELALGGRIEGLNNPKLGEEVEKDETGYYRTLYFCTDSKKYDITKVYFTKNGDFDAEKTEAAIKKSEYKVLGKKLEYEITEDLEFKIKADSQKEIKEKLEEDRNILIKMINNMGIADYDVFSGLNKQEKIKKDKETQEPIRTWQFNSEIICLDPISSIYKIYLNIEGVVDPIYCKVEGNNVVLVDETGRTRDVIYFNYTKNKNNYYKITKGEERLNIEKLSQKIENPGENLPAYTGELAAIKLLKDPGNLSNYDDYLKHFDSKGSLIAEMPCDKKEDGSYEFNEEKYNTNVEALKLYNYPGFKQNTDNIQKYAKDLGITDATIISIYTKSLENENFDFENQKVVEITDPSIDKKDRRTGNSIYYNVNKNFEITESDLYRGAPKKCIELLETRLDLANKVNNSKVWWINGKEKKDFEMFYGGESGIGKQIISPEELENFISGKTNQITVKIYRGKGELTEVIYTADGKKLNPSLKSGETKGTITFENQLYNMKLDRKTGDVSIDPKEIRN